MSTAAQTVTQGESHTTGTRSLGWYGMVFFLASEAVFFANLIASYLYLRVRAGDAWPHVEVDQTLALVNTIILVSSSFPMHFGARAIARGNKRGLTIGLGLTFLLGATFIGIQVFEYATNAFGPSSNIYGSAFYTLTGFHGAHVTAGLLFIAVCFFRSTRGHFSKDHHFAVTAAEMYWHFVDAVWILLVTLLYFVVH